MNALLLASCLLLPGPLPGPLPGQDDPAEKFSYLRLIEEEQGLRLELATRRFRYTREDGADTVVSLVGVMHIADAGYYDTLQTQLDAQDVVLFEQVTESDPGAALLDATSAARARVAATHRRLGTLLGAAARYRSDVGRAPKSVAALVKATQDQRVRRRLIHSTEDAWGQPILFERGEDGEAGEDGGGLRAISLGADGAPGGEGLDADIALDAADAPPFEAEGIQKTLADALGLVFQLEGMDYASEDWRRCDVTLSELQTMLAENGADANVLLSALRGGSALETLASGLLKFVGATKTGRGMLKLVGVEALARAEEMMTRPPAGFEGLFEVLLVRRNQVVLQGLRTLLEQEPQHASVAVFYGAGHMSGLDEGLIKELGLEPLDATWLTAVDLRYEDTGLPRSQVLFLRSTISKALDKQLGGGKR